MSELDKEELKATRELNKNKYKGAEIFGVSNNKKAIESFKDYINVIENRQEYLYDNEEFYKDDIEQNELLLKMSYSVLNYIKQLEADTKKKDKIIDEMAKTIIEDTLKLDTFWCNGCQRIDRCPFEDIEECIKQYFERKVKEDGI